MSKGEQSLYNVALITLDSCRLDVAKQAKLKFLTTLSPEPIAAEAYGTYTLPSHTALLSGRMPRPLDDTQLIKGYDMIWSSVGSKNRGRTSFGTLNSKSLISHFEEEKYNVRGYGGVQYFNTNLPLNLATSYFNKFTYFGSKKNITEEKLLPRDETSFPLGNVDVIQDNISRTKHIPYFLFINCPETHVPYDTPHIKVDDEYKNAITDFNHLSASKKHYPNGGVLLERQKELILSAQKSALEWVDGQLAILFASLPQEYPTLFLVMADHGEELGEHHRYGHGHVSPQVLEIPIWASFSG